MHLKHSPLSPLLGNARRDGDDHFLMRHGENRWGEARRKIILNLRNW